MRADAVVEKLIVLKWVLRLICITCSLSRPNKSHLLSPVIVQIT